MLSEIVVHLETPLATLGEQLEGRISRRLAEGRLDVGPAGSVRYSAKRGRLSLSVHHNQLVVQTPLQARADACRGESCYASCEPEAIVTAQVPLLLQPGYDFDRANVSLRFTRGCKVKTLGGFLTLDVTPTLSSALEPELARVASQIQQELRDVREEVERIWEQLLVPRELPLGGCLVPNPQNIAQGPLDDSTTVMHARFAVLARPELRTTCGELPGPTPLPALQRDLAMPDDASVTLGLVTALDRLHQAFARAPELVVEQRRLRVKASKVKALGSDVVVELTLGGDVCGELSFAATPSFAGAGDFIGLAGPRWLAGERERLAAQGLNPDRLLQALAGAPQLSPMLSVAAIQTAAPAMVELLSIPDLDLKARIFSTEGAGAAVRGDELVAWIRLLGRLDVKASSVPNRRSR